MYTVPTLPYNYNALEPAISEKIMRLHHDKHHQAYVDKLNTAIEAYTELHGASVESLLDGSRDIPEDIKTAVRNNGGGHLNHSLFWQWMSPEATGIPSGELFEAVVQKYGSFEAFQAVFSEKAKGLFGSGWVWLLDTLDIVQTSNQDTPISDGKTPILGLDVWEHAYYLDYENHRDTYIEQWWSIVNWQLVQQLYTGHMNLQQLSL